ncbi:hypothetical protein FKM82_022847 [Ascaphus truei]
MFPQRVFKIVVHHQDAPVFSKNPPQVGPLLTKSAHKLKLTLASVFRLMYQLVLSIATKAIVITPLNTGPAVTSGGFFNEE